MENGDAKIAVIINRWEPIGGAERLAWEQYQEFLRRGYRTRFIVLSARSARGELCEIRSLFDLVGIVRLARFLRSEDVVISHMWFGNAIGRIAALLAGVKTIIAVEHNIASDTLKTKRMLVFDRLLQHFSTTVAVSAEVKRSLARRGIVKRVILIENGIDLVRIKDAPCIELPYPRPIYLFAGRLTHQKGADVLLKAFKKISAGTLLVAGSGPDEAALKQTAGKRVVFLGLREDIPSLLRSCDCFVFPSRWEGFSIVLLEAMAAGVPIVVSAYSALPEEARACAAVVPVEDADALAEAMRHIPAPGLIDLRRFSIERNVDELSALFGSARIARDSEV